MAELHVQRKRNNSQWIWILLVLLIIAGAVYWYLNYYHKNGEAGFTTSDTSATRPGDSSGTLSVASSDTVFWKQVDFNSPDTTYAEVTSKYVTEKANKNYAIYSMNVPALFVENKSELTAPGESALREIGASINQRFKDAEVKIYSHPDSSIKKENNRLLSAKRAEVVKLFLTNNLIINERQISVFPADENSNRIDIVAKR